MPRNRRSSRDKIDIDVFNLQVLDAPDGLDTALHAFEVACHRGNPEIAEMVEALDSPSYLLEYLVSALEEGAYAKFSKWIITGFPTSTEPNMNTVSMRLLQRFSSSLPYVEYPSAADVPHNLRASRRMIELLKNLEENANGALAGGNVSPVSRKKGKAVTQNRSVDPLPFDSMGIAVPTTDEEIRDVYIRILLQLRGILENCLLVLRKPTLSQIFKSAYIKAKPPSEEIPTIQPLKVTFCFDDVKGFGEWSILVSARAQKDLRDAKRADGATFRVVMKKLKQLSQGRFSRSNQKPLTGPKTELPIYEAMITDNSRLVYHIHCIPDPRTYHEADVQYDFQVIRVFGVFTLAQLHHGGFWDNVSRQLQQRGTAYIERCIFQKKHPSAGDNTMLPAKFPLLQHHVPQAVPLVKVTDEDMKDIHSLLVLDKFVILSQALLNSILAGREVAHVFSLSAQEQEIIEHPSSCYVIGRSGTGKTTTMLFKMLAIQRTWQQYPDMGPKPRQLFVTQSRVLASRVEGYFIKLMASLESAAHSPEELRKDNDQEIVYIDQDDNKRWRSDLPDKFSGLLDEHFPLFITYDRLCMMLQNDIKRGNHNHGFMVPGTRAPRDEAAFPTSPTSARRPRLHAGSGSTSKFVSYSEFLASYWDRLPQTVTRVLDPALVFGEFMGVIKGSEDTIGTRDRCLDRGSYKSLSVRNQGTFYHKRDDIYDLFVAYTKLKQQRQDYDAADRTHYISKELREGGLVGQKVDYLYVDEVQDNLLIDTLILRTICANRHGLFWAGDTAQTISIGSSFQFADLKAYHHRIEKQISDELGIAPVEPRAFELALNYRSHSGIVNCARSVVELILHYWPYSIDSMQPERANVDGFRPMFFTGQGNADLEKSFFGDNQGKPIEFGASQCILVRNDTVKTRLQQMLRGSLIMTLYESKGLEFDDVLLYNFFKDSTAKPSQWRLVLNRASDWGSHLSAPTFDETRHASICTELKFLYVAITRARNNLWIVDGSELAEPMKVYWSSKDQVEVWSSTAEIPRLAVSSTPEEWTETARTMFFNKRYAQASVAFQRAGRMREAGICDAYLFRERARSIPTTAGEARIEAFIVAANAFTRCVRDSLAKRVNERLAYYGAAGECYLEARDSKNAGDNYRMAEQYPAAARAYREGGYFDEMVEVIIRHRNTFDSRLVKRLTMAAQMHYFKRLNIKAALKLFPSEVEALEFLEDYDLDEARAELLVQLGRVLTAAEIHAKNGNMLKAVKILTASAHRVDHVRPTIEYLLTGLWRGLTFGVLPTSDSIASKLLVLAVWLDESAMTEQEVDELAMFKAIQGADRTRLRTLARIFIKTGNNPAALLCLDHVFSAPLKLQNLPLSGVQALLSPYLDYVRLLNKFRRDESLAQGSNHQRLFGFKVLGENRYLASRYTLLHEKLAGLNRGGVDGYTCGSDELRRGITQLIKSRISDRTKIQDDACREVHGFSPCLRLLVEKRCDPPKGEGSCTFQHIQPEQLTVDWYHSRLRLILLQFQILNLTQGYDLPLSIYWLGILYSALHPPFRALGSFANLDKTNIPNGATGFKIVREWVKSACYDPNYKSVPVDRSMEWFMVLCTLAFDLDRENAQNFVPYTPLYTSMYEEGDLIVQNFVTFSDAKKNRSLTCGSSCLREIVRDPPVCVDLNVLCDLVERLSGLFIMSKKVKKGVLHNVALPRSWFTKLVFPGMDLKKDTSNLSTFLETTIELMQGIDAQARPSSTSASDTEEQFIADDDQTIDFTGPLYVVRICFCLCLIGYNDIDGKLNKKILTGIQSLRRGGRRLTPGIYGRYADAKDWDDLLSVFAESVKKSSPDDIILLLHTTNPGLHEQHSEWVRPISHSQLSEIPQLLAPSALKTGDAPAEEQRSNVEAAIVPRSDGQGQQKPIDNTPRERAVDGKKAGAVVPGGFDEEIEEDPRINATKVVQDAYRRHLKRKKMVRRGIEATRAHYWRLLRARSMEMEWPKDSQYYLLFRVPLAYILACLDTVKAFIESEKKEAKKRLMIEDHADLEGSMEALNQFSKLIQKAAVLQKKLAPSSKFHEGQSVSDLQQAVLEVKTIVESLDDTPRSTGTKHQIKKLWEQGLKWIFEKQGSGAKGKKGVKSKP